MPSLFCNSQSIKVPKVRTTIIALFILLLTFTICCLYPGTPIAKKQIWESTRSFLPQIGTIEFIGRNSMEVMKFHFYNNFIRIEHNVPCLAISLVSVIGMTYYLTNGLYVFNKDKFQVMIEKASCSTFAYHTYSKYPCLYACPLIILEFAPTLHLQR